MADTVSPVVKFKKRGAKAAPRKAAPPPPRSDPEDSSSGSEAEDEDGRVVKKRRLNGNALKASTTDQARAPGFEGATQYEASRSAVIEANNDATKSSNWYEDNADDTRSKKNAGGAASEKEADAPPERKVGPQKSSTNVRMITMMDYKPDVCKDYKQYGYCGFGDGCIFAHIREDNLAGWKLDREWELSNKGKKKASGTVVASANRDLVQGKDDDDVDWALVKDIPFVCIICKKDYKNPIATKCGHYFCEACALKRFRRDPTCANCGAKTYGVFNGARNLQKLLDRKKKVEEKRKKEEEEAAKAEEAGT